MSNPAERGINALKTVINKATTPPSIREIRLREENQELGGTRNGNTLSVLPGGGGGDGVGPVTNEPSVGERIAQGVVHGGIAILLWEAARGIAGATKESYNRHKQQKINTPDSKK